jgi:CO dehydrogenase maturation factor
LLGQLERPGRTVVADFEAGLGTVLRMDGQPVDVVVVVVEPTAKSLDVGRRAAEAVVAGGLGRVVVTANRIRDTHDESRVRAAFPGLEPVLVPDEPAIVATERRGEAPFDAAADSPGVQALVRLAEGLLPRPAETR